MFAVVQIGSKARRSPCITARIVLPAAGCARSTEGAWVSAAAAAVVCRNVRRVAFMASSPWRGVRMPLAGIGAIEARDALRGKRRLRKALALSLQGRRSQGAQACVIVLAVLAGPSHGKGSRGARDATRSILI